MKRTVTVQAGDTLTGIALRELGAARHWKLLWKMNADTLIAEQRRPARRDMQGPDWIFPGTSIVVPVVDMDEVKA